MLVSIFSTDPDALKQLAGKICSGGLVYPQYGMYMIQAFVERTADLDDCFKMPSEGGAAGFANMQRGTMVAHVPDMSKLKE